MLPVSTKEKTLSRSYMKQIGFGRSKYGGSSRTKKSRVDYINEKRRKEGLSLFKEHHRTKMQTLEDYIAWVESGFSVYCPDNPCCCGSALVAYQRWLNGKEETDELVKQYAKILWKKDRSK